MYKLTEEGKKVVAGFLEECKSLRKIILNAGKDTADETDLPDEEAILADVELFIDENGEYINCFGLTDKYNSPAIRLRRGIELEVKGETK